MMPGDTLKHSIVSGTSQPLVRRGSSISAEVPQAASAEEQKEMEDKVISPEKAEEAKVKARYPHLRQNPGGSDFLSK